MKKIFFIIAFLSIGLSSYAQITTDTKWDGHYYLPLEWVFNGKYFVLKNIETVRILPQQGTLLHMVGYNSGNENTRLTIDTYNQGVKGGALTFRRLRGDTLNPTAPLLGDVLGSLNVDGYGIDRFLGSSSGGLVVWAKENFSNTNRGTYVTLMSTSNGDTVNKERMRIDDDGISYSNTTFGIGNPLTDSTFGRLPNGKMGLIPPQGGTYKTTTSFNADTVQLIAKRDSNALHYVKLAAKLNIIDTIALARDNDIADMQAKINLKASINGSVVKTVLRLTASITAYVVTATDACIHVVGTLAQPITLPTAASSTGREIEISYHSTLAGTVSIAYRTSGAATSTALTAGQELKIRSDGTEWYAVSN